MNLTSPTPLPPWVLCSSETSTRGLHPGVGGAEGPSHSCLICHLLWDRRVVRQYDQYDKCTCVSLRAVPCVSVPCVSTDVKCSVCLNIDWFRPLQLLTRSVEGSSSASCRWLVIDLSVCLSVKMLCCHDIFHFVCVCLSVCHWPSRYPLLACTLLPTAREGNVFRGVCNSVHNQPHIYSVTAHPCYSPVCTHHTGMPSC